MKKLTFVTKRLEKFEEFLLKLKRGKMKRNYGEMVGWERGWREAKVGDFMRFHEISRHNLVTGTLKKYLAPKWATCQAMFDSFLFFFLDYIIMYLSI